MREEAEGLQIQGMQAKYFETYLLYGENYLVQHNAVDEVLMPLRLYRRW